MRYFFPIYFFLFSLYNTFSIAQSPAEPLTLRQALLLCQENNYTIRQQEEMLQAATEKVNEQRTNFFPTAFLNSSYNYVSELAILELPFSQPNTNPIVIEAGVKNKYDFNASIIQPVFRGFRTRNLIKSAREEMFLQEENRKVLLNQLLLHVHQIYYGIQLNQLQQNVLNSSVLRLENHLRMIVSYYHAKQITPYDTMKTANQLLALQTDLAEIKHQNKIYLSRLAELLNVKQITQTDTLSLREISLSLQPLEFFLEKAFQTRPELSQIKHKVLAQEYKVNAMKSGFFPQITARASYHYAKPGVNFFKDEWMDYYTVGLTLQWEIWNWGRTHMKVKQGKYLKTYFSIEEEKLLESVRQDVTENYEQLLNDREQIVLAKRLVKQEKDRLRNTEEKYKQGQVTSVDLSDAENGLTSAELKLQQSYIRWLLDSAEMRHAMGTIANTTGKNFR